jgi:sortase A
MAGKNTSPELNESELRRLLIERRTADRKRRLEAFKRTGELLPLDHQPATPVATDPLANPRVLPKPGLDLKSPTSSPRQKWASRLLFAVEAGAALGLILVFLAGLNTLDQLNSQVAALFADQSVPSPTPLLSPVVLPSGHTSPGDPGGARPNTAEIPAHLLPQVQAYNASLILPTPGPEQAQRISIPEIEVSAPVVQGDDWEALKRGVGQHIGSADAGQPGNLVLSGHNDIYGEVFRHLDQLAVGDEITIETPSRTYTYQVTDTLVVAPDFVEVLAPTETATLTLISCYPYLIDSQRIVVQAALKN